MCKPSGTIVVFVSMNQSCMHVWTDYEKDIMYAVRDHCRTKRAERSPYPLGEAPPTLTASSGAARPRKADAIAAHVDRFYAAPL